MNRLLSIEEVLEENRKFVEEAVTEVRGKVDEEKARRYFWARLWLMGFSVPEEYR
jgi:hypothetical protein